VKLGEGFFYYFALDHRAAELEDRMLQGSATAADHAAMAVILKSKGEVRLALEEARQAEALDPSLKHLRSELEVSATSSPPLETDSQATSREAVRRMATDLERGDTAAAERDLKEGLEASPQDAELLFNLGVLYEQTARPADALASYRRAVASRPEHADAWNNLGSLYANEGDLEKARECWERAASLNPPSPAAENLRRLATESRQAPP